MAASAQRPHSRLLLPDVPAIAVGACTVAWFSPDGEMETLTREVAARRLATTAVLHCHSRSLARRIGIERIGGFDLLELFAFVHPARFCRPTPRGLAEAIGLIADLAPAAVDPGRSDHQDLEAEALALPDAATRLLAALAEAGRPERSDPVAIAWTMGLTGHRGDLGGTTPGWPWAPYVLAALGQPAGPPGARLGAGLSVWRDLPEWAEQAPDAPPGQTPVEPQEARHRLAAMVQVRSHAEARPQQSDYASAVTMAFAPRSRPDMPNMVLAEAGTGVGKTLGYLAPATLWAERNHGPVWISTYTRNLQRQLDAELDRLHPDPAIKERKVVVRKGRENYLCLLNLEEAVSILPNRPDLATALGLMARWTAATRDGDLQGGDLPGWLIDLLGWGKTLGLADRRGECIFSACGHYSRCFIERNIRRARRADIVIANHALVLIQSALGGVEDSHLPTRYVFDEGHHVFDAADSAFAGHLTGAETAELRRWLLGAETGNRRRARGLQRRLEDLLAGDEPAVALMDAIALAARALPGENWMARLDAGNPTGVAEHFLALVRQQVMARASSVDGPYSLETETGTPIEGLSESAQALDQTLEALLQPLAALSKRLALRLDEEAATLDPDSRRRIEGVCRSLHRRGEVTLAAWRAMVAAIGQPTPADFVDWFGIQRSDGRDQDIGMYRHHLDPTRPLAATLGAQAHGIVMTSATLTDGTGDGAQDWLAAEQRTGASHLPVAAIRARVPSPFDYPAQTRVLVVKDVRKDDLVQVAAAYRELFLAADGGALGLFTAIGRLRAVHQRIAAPLEAAGLPLYAQHLDGLDVSTLIDIFRGEEQACLLGTDAVRDGVDVPGRSLRLIVFDRVPWPRPDILHRARREAFGGRRYDDLITRLRLKQAFGRLVRRADDAGVFVLLDPMMPSRLCGAFPPGVTVQRVGLAEAVRLTRDFLAVPVADGSPPVSDAAVSPQSDRGP
ncbi:MAG: ATP-dependent DNA helicase [Azospirillaceae bacterium]|nr:ATP-dependent DNA helicase [Azospirillaceae bacterium]